MDLITKLKDEDPCPAFSLFEEGIGGRIKVRPEDFQVEEIPCAIPPEKATTCMFSLKNGHKPRRIDVRGGQSLWLRQP